MKDFKDLRRGDFVQSKEYPQGLFVSEVRGGRVTVLIPKEISDPANWEIKPLREVLVEDVPSLPPTRRPIGQR